ncbi:MAG: uroporphyrinogen-III decarboxylase-like protein [Anaerolineae bacterium]|nr:uroporphyrinogen-III decarboxylase-like protein [Anaerolineae bacterium]
MPTETMTSYERWLAVLTRKTPDRVPLDYWATAETDQKLVRAMGCDDLEEALAQLHVDRPLSIGPRYVGPAIPDGYDVFGVQYKPVDYGTGIYDESISAPLAGYNTVDEIERDYAWPDPDWYDYGDIPARIEGQEHRPIRGGGSEPLLIYKKLRGEEQAFMDMILNPEIVHYCLDKLFDLAYENTRRIYEQIPGKVLISYVAEDMGSQEGLMLSPQQIHTFLLPRMKRMIDLVHEAGAFVFHHNDGAVRDILPDMIELGIDVLNPIQWRCRGMEREGLKRDFGDQLVFHGAMDNQYTLPFGTAYEVRQQVIENFSILGVGGGYILAPCHNMQAVMPVENIIAMYETAYEHGWS